ncbi:MAG: tRNA lysidine(34) synthetase TilS [Planctomycetaceae bacterium]|nr:tRNA lysidine(34) synthetase TilS [Planctomycetaceae bacterium]
MTGSSTLLDRIAAAWPVSVWSDVPVLIAVSGGSDSVALLRALHQLAPPGHTRLFVAHFNHQLRDGESDADERWVADLARSLKLECHVGRGAVHAQAALDGDGIEAAARSQRYAFLTDTAAALGARYVVTAHTADDQAETILHRIVRGTGLVGLAGIRRVRPLNEACSLVRPLLAFRRQELRGWLAELGQDYRDDGSNLDRTYTRNRLRHDLLPQLARDYNPQVIEALLRLGDLAGDAQELIDADVERFLHGHILQQTAERVVLSELGTVTPRSDYFVRESLVALWQRQRWSLQSMTFEHWQRLAEIWRGAQRDVNCFPGGVIATRDGDRLMLTGPSALDS